MKPVAARRRRPGRRSLAAFAAVTAGVLVLWGYGLARFAALIPEQVDDTVTRTDAIVVLTGGSGRLDEGLKLLGENLAERMFISGVYQGVDVSRLFELSRNAPPELAERIEIGHAADNTAGNAAETAEWVRGHQIHSLRVVTSVYHLPRSLLEFRHALPDVVLVPHPVFADHVKRKEWWLWPGTARLIVGEYTKYLLALARQSGETLAGPPVTVAGSGGR